MNRGVTLFVTVATAIALLSASGAAPHAAGTPAAAVRLKTITSRVSGDGASLVIETSDPAGYVALRPDPLTVTVDFRNVSGEGVANSVAASARSPIAGVKVEQTQSLDMPASRVRISLSEPVAHRVRSDRNTVVIDFDKPTGLPAVRPVLRQQDSGTLVAQTATVDPIAALGLGETQAPETATTAQTTPQTTPDAAPPQVAAQLPQPQQAGQPGLATQIGQNARPAAAQAPQTSQPALTAQAAQEQAQPAAQAQAAPRFSGNPISLDFQGADLRAVLRSFAEISGLNMVIDPQVTGTVDVALRDVPWDQALDIILRANGLSYRIDGTIVRIAPVAVFTAEDRARGVAASAAAEAGQLTTVTRQLSYSTGEEVVAALKQGSILSSRGTVFVDPRTKTLIVTDLQDRLANVSQLIDTIDKPQPQVEIEARIVQTNKTYARALGIQWGFNGYVSPQLGNTTNLAFPNNGTIGGGLGTQGAPTTGTGINPATGTRTAVNLPAAGATSAVGLQLGSINGAFNLDVALTALENSGNGRLLSTPKVSTLNNIAAEITQGVQIPIQTATNNTVTVTFRDAALSLKVTPQITAANTVIMQIALENATPDFGRQVNGIPPINTQRAITSVLVLDGQTTVIGGIYTSTMTSSRDQTPGLGSIPILGWLFKRERIDDQNTELLIFITPKIIKTS